MEIIMRVTIQMTQEDNGGWKAQALELPELTAEGKTPQATAQSIQAVVLRHIAERLERAEFVPVLEEIAFDMPYFEPIAERRG